ncbi:MAG: glycolate oxidase subunit GlcE [Gammaproteobacteria bacterium]|jgi:glycolate oxidase FAD binding subunit
MTVADSQLMEPVESLQAMLQAASRSVRLLAIHGAGSKAFYGRQPRGEPCSVRDYRGVIDYSPTELVIRARAGTPLADIEALLAGENQMLAFEPPYFGTAATLGGTIASGLSGPRRPYTGAARDFVLGITCLNGKGDHLRFGGEVMKNVAGYDVARTLTGSLGTLAVLLDISLKVLPRPEREITVCRESTPAEAIRLLNRWAAQPLPLSGGCYHDGQLAIRLSGTERGVRAALGRLGGTAMEDAAAFWEALREQRLDHFAGNRPLWRLSVPPATPPLALEGESLIDWGGAQRWIRTSLPATEVRIAATRNGGHAVLFRGGERDAVFHPLPAPLLALHRRLKHSFDPAGILNPGRMYAEL